MCVTVWLVVYKIIIILLQIVPDVAISEFSNINV